MPTGIIEAPLRAVLVQGGAELFGALLLPVTVFLLIGGVAALATALVARRERTPKVSPTLRPAA